MCIDQFVPTGFGFHRLLNEMDDRQVPAQGAADVDFAIHQKAGAQETIGSQAQTVAVLAEMFAKQGNETDCSHGARDAVSTFRAVANWSINGLQVKA